MDFTDKHIVVTGGTGALGSGVAAKLLEAGAVCSIPCFEKSAPESFSLRDHENLYLQTNVDLTEENETTDFYTKAIDRQGPLWGSVHIAGGFDMGRIEDLAKADFMKQINMNLVTCFNCCNRAIENMRDDGGRIVNIASKPALEQRQGAGRAPYMTSKAGVAALTTSLGQEVVDDKILVNAVAPSTIDTPANRNSMPDADYDQWTKPKEIANQIMYLVSEENTITQGAVIPIYGRS